MTVGNKRFRDAVANSLEDYMQANDRFRKSVVVQSIVEDVHQLGGRFLKKNPKTKEWYELTDQQAKEKVGHAIRDAVTAQETRMKKKAKLKKAPKDPDRKPSPLAVEAERTSNMGQASASLSSPVAAGKSRIATGTTPERSSSRREAENEDDGHDHFLAKINAVLGPLPSDAEDPMEPLLDEPSREGKPETKRR